MTTRFNHENLKVYQRALQFAATANSWIAEWEKKHAICDQLSRAAGSVVENIAMASAAYSSMKAKGLDYALGSTLECAACVDIAGLKSLLDNPSAIRHKRELLELFRMLVGLRQSWARGMVRENPVPYGHDEESSEGSETGEQDGEGFHHERLDVYRVALETVVVFSSPAFSGTLASSAFRRLDELLTSIVLNIAEGNGRFSGADQQRFLGTAHEAAIKMAANLDLHVIQKALSVGEVDKCKALLSRVAAMTAIMTGKTED